MNEQLAKERRDRLQQYKDDQNLRNTEIAIVCDVCETTVWRWLSGQTPIGRLQMEALDRKFGGEE